MKRVLKPIIITTILMLAIGGAAFYFLNKSANTEEVGEFNTRREDDQSDQMDAHAFRSDTEVLAIELAREGDQKNVLNFDNVNVFSTAHSKESRERLDRLIRRMSPDFENPIIAYNPFGTMPNSYYFYFKTPQRCMVKYTVTVADEKIPDHIRYVNNGEVKNMTAVHEFTVGGLVPGMMNYIILELVDESGSHRQDITYKVMVPTTTAPARLDHERGKSELRLQNGLFFVMPKNDEQMYIYDNAGVMRGVVATESDHGCRVYNNDKNIVYQISPDRVIRVNRLGMIDGVAMFDGHGGILDFAYDDFDNCFALVSETVTANQAVTKEKGKKAKGKKAKGKKAKGKSAKAEKAAPARSETVYKILRASMGGGNAEEVYTFDKGAVPTSISKVSGGNLYVSLSSPMGIMRIDGLISKKARVGLVLGKKDDWKKSSVKKKYVLDPTEEKKKKEEGEDGKDASGDTKDASSDSEDKETSEEETAESAESTEERAEGEDAGATPAPKKENIKPLVGWDMTDTMLYLVDDESNGKQDTLTFAVKKDRLVHAIKLKLDGKKKTAEILLDKETEFDGRLIVQWGQRESCVIANRSRGKYEERDELFKVTREYSFPAELDGLWKLNLQGMCFY